MIANFPSLAPSARAWQPGTPPVGVFVGMAGTETRMRYGSKAVGATLSLTYAVLEEVDVWLVVNHHQLAAGTEAFTLPTAVFAGMTTAPSGLTWRYGGAPTVTWLSPGLASVQVDLVQVI
jgi:hypothetical protein